MDNWEQGLGTVSLFNCEWWTQACMTSPFVYAPDATVQLPPVVFSMKEEKEEAMRRKLYQVNIVNPKSGQFAQATLVASSEEGAAFEAVRALTEEEPDSPLAKLAYDDFDISVLPLVTLRDVKE